jgi:hypothetical protein
MTLGFPTLLTKIQENRYNIRQGHMPSNPAAAARGLRSRCHVNSPVAPFLRDDRHARNKQYNKNK